MTLRLTYFNVPIWNEDGYSCWVSLVPAQPVCALTARCVTGNKQTPRPENLRYEGLLKFIYRVSSGWQRQFLTG